MTATPNIMTQPPRMDGPVALYLHTAMGHDLFVENLKYWGNSEGFRYNVCNALQCPQAGDAPQPAAAVTTPAN